jgi:hypothetical protein
MKNIPGVKKGFIIKDEFVENENGNFYAFESAEALKEFFDKGFEIDYECIEKKNGNIVLS